jgi:hypothetical protein
VLLGTVQVVAALHAYLAEAERSGAVAAKA